MPVEVVLSSIRALKACVVYIGVVCIVLVSQKACIGGSLSNIRASKACLVHVVENLERHVKNLIKRG